MERTEIIEMLEPFAEEAGEWSKSWPDAKTVAIDGQESAITVGSLRALARLRQSLIAEEIASIETQTETLRHSDCSEKGVIDTAVHACRQGWIAPEQRDMAITMARNIVVARNNKGLGDD